MVRLHYAKKFSGYGYTGSKLFINLQLYMNLKTRNFNFAVTQPSWLKRNIARFVPTELWELTKFIRFEQNRSTFRLFASNEKQRKNDKWKQTKQKREKMKILSSYLK